MYHRFNFYKHTFCEFKRVAPEELPPIKPHYKSKSGSTYYFTTLGVFRVSNHWGRAANCRWRLLDNEQKSQMQCVGYANWSDFYPNDETARCFFIQFDAASQKATFQHCQHPSFSQQALFTAAQAQQRILLIHEICEGAKWFLYAPEKYLLPEYKFLIIQKIIETTLAIPQLKHQIRNGFLN